ncbi:hypothetical protein SEA_SHAKENBAKE_102 [Streptomyces phage ShakeNBake]|nr:hypothetical protein SEA_PHTOWN_102 [Streptomyces phage PHTowN]QNO12919.1 hypothetical protein SEA_SHAKENBAKE_102 [Streptomyces phage ShakeNBake]
MSNFTIKSIASAAPGYKVKLIPNIVDEDVNNDELIVHETVVAWAVVVSETGRERIEPVFLNEDYMPIVASAWEEDEESGNELADPTWEVLRDEDVDFPMRMVSVGLSES